MVVKKFDTPDGIGGRNVTSYKYWSLRADLKGRGPQGFKKIQETVSGGIESIEHDFYQEFPYSFMEKSATHKINGRTLSVNQKTYSSRSESPIRIHLSNENIKLYELDGKLVKDINTEFHNVDEYGNVGEVRKRVSGGNKTFVEKTINTYNTSMANAWFIGRLEHVIVNHEDPSGRSLSRETTFRFDPITRLLMEEIRQKSDPLALRIKYKYDHYGNVIEKTDEAYRTNHSTGKPPSPRTASMRYDSSGTRLLSTSNCLGHTESYEYDALGNMVKLTGVNGLATTWTYDKFDRPLTESHSNGQMITWEYTFTDFGASAVYTEVRKELGKPTEVKYFDQLGRVIRTSVEGFEHTSYRDIVFDRFGRVSKQSLPYIGKASARQWVYFVYDDSGREVSVTKPISQDTSETSRTVYTDLVREHIDSKGHSTKYTKDALERIVQVEDAAGEKMTYEYDPLGNLVRTTDAVGNVLEMTFDIFGNKISSNDPDMGRWTYRYDVFGQTVWQKDAMGQETNMEYDSLGRLIKTSEKSGVKARQWVYDIATNGRGKVAKVTGTNGFIREYKYDAQSRETMVRSQIDGEIFEVNTSYNSFGKVSQQTYPGNKKIIYCYDHKGFLLSVQRKACSELDSSFYWKAQGYDQEGRVVNEEHGNGLQTEYAYNLAGHLTETITRNPENGQVIRQWNHEYDKTGNLVKRVDGLIGTEEKFTYDALDRVTRATLHSTDPSKQQRFTEDWEYDVIGNIRRYSGFGGLHHEYHQDKPHALTRAGPNTYTYDANGNLIQKNNQSLGWTTFNKPEWFDTKDGKRVHFFYDPDQDRYMRRDGENDITIYIGKVYERSKSGTAGNIVTRQKYFIYANGKLTAVETQTTTGSSSHSSVLYPHADRLGSIDTVTNEEKVTVETIRYNAFGLQRPLDWARYKQCHDFSQPGSLFTKRGFTGHEHIYDLDLIHMNGRVFDPLVGRFLSPDPYIQDPHNPQNFNRYSYVLNNPLKHTDPSGHFFKKIAKFVKKFWKPIVAVAASVVTFGAATPLAAGLVASAGLTGTLAAVATGSIAGAAAGFVGSTVTTGSVKEGMKGAVGGAIFGGVGGYFGSVWNPERVISQAVAGGTASELSGGKFKDGFLTAGVTASARYLYNALVDYDVTWKPGGQAVAKCPSCPPVRGANNVGTYWDPNEHGGRTVDPSGWFNEGGRVSRFFNGIPGVNAVAGMHDVFQIDLDRVQIPFARDIFNVPGMPVAAAVSYTALMDGPQMQALLVDKRKRENK